MGKTKEMCSRIQQRAPNCVVKHCMIHREALAVKKLSVNCEQPTELEKCLDDVIKIVNLIRANKQGKSCRIFSKICEDMDEEHKTLFLHSEVRWLSKGNVLTRFYQLREPVAEFLKGIQSPISSKMDSATFLIKVAYLADIFKLLNKLNKELQGKGKNMFTHTASINAFKSKISRMEKRVKSFDFSSFSTLHSSIDDVAILDSMSVQVMVLDHLNLLKGNFEKYFPEEELSQMDKMAWVVDPFSNEDSLTDDLLTVYHSVEYKTSLKNNGYESFWIRLFKEGFQDALEAIRVLTVFPSSYLCEKGFSKMKWIKNPQRNKLVDLDSCLRLSLNTIPPRFDLISNHKQHHPSH